MLITTSLFGDAAEVPREHGPATLGVHCSYFRHPYRVLANLVGGHGGLRSRGITDCLVATIKVTRCDGRVSTDVPYPPFGAHRERSALLNWPGQNRPF